MLTRHATLEHIETAAQGIGSIENLQQVGRTGYRFVLRPLGDHYRRVSASVMFHDGRRVNAVCWHGHREFFSTLFEVAPECKVQTALTRSQPFGWYTAANFVDVYTDTDRNIGAPVAPIAHSDACMCDEGAYAHLRREVTS